MERVAFLVEHTGARLRCLLNPQSVSLHATAGLTVPHYAQGSLTGRGAAANSALFNGGGFREIDLDLVFDVTLAQGATVTSTDVRDHTRPITELTENQPSRVSKIDHPPFIRFVWGKTWNIRAIVRQSAERLEYFDSSGTPRRAWLRLRLLQVPDTVDADEARAREAQLPLDPDQANPTISETEEPQIHTSAPASTREGATSTDRLDQLAELFYGHPGKWRIIAEANNLDSAASLPAGTALSIPKLEGQ